MNLSICLILYLLSCFLFTYYRRFEELTGEIESGSNILLTDKVKSLIYPSYLFKIAALSFILNVATIYFVNAIFEEYKIEKQLMIIPVTLMFFTYITSNIFFPFPSHNYCLDKIEHRVLMGFKKVRFRNDTHTLILILDKIEKLHSTHF